MAIEFKHGDILEANAEALAAPHGPYADNLLHVLKQMDGYFVSGYADSGDAPDQELSLVPGAVEDAERFLLDHPATRTRFDKVADLIDGFETPFGLELLSTVHRVCTRDHFRPHRTGFKGVRLERPKAPILSPPDSPRTGSPGEKRPVRILPGADSDSDSA